MILLSSFPSVYKPVTWFKVTRRVVCHPKHPFTSIRVTISSVRVTCMSSTHEICTPGHLFIQRRDTLVKVYRLTEFDVDSLRFH